LFDEAAGQIGVNQTALCALNRFAETAVGDFFPPRETRKSFVL
jgi:hypothetical protein